MEPPKRENVSGIIADHLRKIIQELPELSSDIFNAAHIKVWVPVDRVVLISPAINEQIRRSTPDKNQ